MSTIKQVARGRAGFPAWRASKRLSMMCVALVSMLAGCKESSAKPSQTVAGGQPSTQDVQTTLASIGDERITMAEIRARSGDDLDRLETQYQLAKSKIISATLDSIVHDRTVVAEAQKEGKSVEDLVTREAGSGLEPTDLEVTTWFNENPDRVNGRPLDQVKSQIVDYLRNVHRAEAAEKLEARLRTEDRVVVNYHPYRLEFANADAPTRGKASAPITLVEFSDFQCPFCQRMAPTLKEVAQKYPNDVRIVYRQYPITSLHPFAFKAAEASLCARDQGKFWEMHDAMFQDQKKLTVSDLKATATRLGMDSKKFNSCLDSGRYVEQVQNDSKEAQRAGVTGTPAIFVNGSVIDGGAVPFNVVEAAIQKELIRVKADR